VIIANEGFNHAVANVYAAGNGEISGYSLWGYSDWRSVLYPRYVFLKAIHF